MVVLVVVAPGAGTVVVTAANAWRRTAGSSNCLSARFTGAPNVRPPSFDTATTGDGGLAFGELGSGGRC